MNPGPRVCTCPKRNRQPNILITIPPPRQPNILITTDGSIGGEGCSCNQPDHGTTGDCPDSLSKALANLGGGGTGGEGGVPPGPPSGNSQDNLFYHPSKGPDEFGYGWDPTSANRPVKLGIQSKIRSSTPPGATWETDFIKAGLASWGSSAYEGWRGSVIEAIQRTRVINFVVDDIDPENHPDEVRRNIHEFTFWEMDQVIRLEQIHKLHLWRSDQNGTMRELAQNERNDFIDAWIEVRGWDKIQRNPYPEWILSKPPSERPTYRPGPYDMKG